MRQERKSFLGFGRRHPASMQEEWWNKAMRNVISGRNETSEKTPDRTVATIND
jgi:hypothetical protein